MNSSFNTHIRGNTDNDTAAEFKIFFEHGTALASAYAMTDCLLQAGLTGARRPR